MSCNYADGLSPYENKGVLGLPESFDSPEKLEKKCEVLAGMMRGAKHIVVHTGAGISTAAGIPDFRGPNGVWTLEQKGKKPDMNISFNDARPTRTHMILRKLVDVGIVKYIVSQNIDALHMRSGLKRHSLSELHGNMFLDQCNVCDRQFIRKSPVETVGKRSSGLTCPSGGLSVRPCRGRLHDAVLDWEHSLPERELLMAEFHSSIADLSICLGTTLQIVPSGNLPVETLRYGGQLVVCNLQPTKHDNKADLKINYYVDDILEKVIKHLNLKISEYNIAEDPVYLAKDKLIEWTIDRKHVVETEKLFKEKCKGVKKKRTVVKRKREKDVDVENINTVKSVKEENIADVEKEERKVENDQIPKEKSELEKDVKVEVQQEVIEVTSGGSSKILELISERDHIFGNKCGEITVVN